MRQNLRLREVSHPRYNYLVTFTQGQDEKGKGTRLKSYFKTKTAALEFMALKKVELANEGNRTGEITAAERRAVLTFRDEVAEAFTGAGARPTLSDAVAYYMRFLRASLRRSTVSVLADELESSKDRAGRSKRHVDDLRSRLGYFCRKFGKRDVRSVTREEIENWLHGLKLAPQSLVNFRRVVSSLFREGIRRKYCETNPVADIDTPKVVGQAPGILTPSKLAEIITLVEKHDPELLPWLVISAFCGLRPAELDRLDWKEVRLSESTPVVEVTAAKAKTARRRLVEIAPNAVEFLLAVRKLAGPVRVVNHRKRWEAVRRLGGYGEPGTETKEEIAAGRVLEEWPADGLRHSFASYHIAHFQDAGRTAMALGHGQNPMLLFNTYRAMVTSDDAARWWQIKPSGDLGKLVAFLKVS